MSSVKKMEQSLVDGGIQGVVVLGEMWLLKELGIMKKSTAVKSIGLIGTVALSELVFDFAKNKGWIPTV